MFEKRSSRPSKVSLNDINFCFPLIPLMFIPWTQVYLPFSTMHIIFRRNSLRFLWLRHALLSFRADYEQLKQLLANKRNDVGFDRIEGNALWQNLKIQLAFEKHKIYFASIYSNKCWSFSSQTTKRCCLHKSLSNGRLFLFHHSKLSALVESFTRQTSWELQIVKTLSSWKFLFETCLLGVDFILTLSNVT